jgi:hypothetical protein
MIEHHQGFKEFSKISCEKEDFVMFEYTEEWPLLQ